MAYVGNVVSFITFLIENSRQGYNVFNYIDKPDFTMNDLIYHVGNALNKHIPTVRFPYWLGCWVVMVSICLLGSQGKNYR